LVFQLLGTSWVLALVPLAAIDRRLAVTPKWQALPRDPRHSQSRRRNIT
jgi:hypothetical protein